MSREPTNITSDIPSPPSHEDNTVEALDFMQKVIKGLANRIDSYEGLVNIILLRHSHNHSFMHLHRLTGKGGHSVFRFEFGYILFFLIFDYEIRRTKNRTELVQFSSIYVNFNSILFQLNNFSISVLGLFNGLNYI